MTEVGYIAAPEIWYFEGVEGEVLTVIAPELLEEKERGPREPSKPGHAHPAAH